MTSETLPLRFSLVQCNRRNYGYTALFTSDEKEIATADAVKNRLYLFSNGCLDIDLGQD